MIYRRTEGGNGGGDMQARTFTSWKPNLEGGVQLSLVKCIIWRKGCEDDVSWFTLKKPQC